MRLGVVTALVRLHSEIIKKIQEHSGTAIQEFGLELIQPRQPASTFTVQHPEDSSERMMATTDKCSSSKARDRPLISEITRDLSPSTSTRLLITLSFPLLIIIALPFWWYTTSIERLPLPTARISVLETSTVRDKASYPVTLMNSARRNSNTHPLHL